MIMRVVYIIFCMLTFLLQGCAVGHIIPEEFNCIAKNYSNTAYFVDTIRIENPVVLRSRNSGIWRNYAYRFFLLPFEEAKLLRHNCTEMDILCNSRAALLDLESGAPGLFFCIKAPIYMEWLDITGKEYDGPYRIAPEHRGLPTLKNFTYMERDVFPDAYCLFLVRGDTYNCAIGACMDCSPDKPIMFKNPCAYYRYCTPIWR